LPAGRCDGTVPGRLPFYVTETPVEVAPAIVGDIIYLPDGQYLYSRDLTTNEFLWPPAKVKADSPISAPPVVAGDVVVFASEDGVVHAVDATDGEALWTWRTGLHVRGSPAVIDGVVFVVSGDGFVYALGA
jgi:outer membrane protein assembly factor BamB